MVFAGDPYQIDLLDIASHQRTALLKHSVYPLLYAQFSPDNRWISFTARIGSNHGRIFAAPFAHTARIPESDDYAIWAADGKTLYFTS